MKAADDFKIYSASQKTMRQEIINITCPVCGTVYVIVTNAVGCFYCPTYNKDRDYSGGTEQFTYRNDQ